MTAGPVLLIKVNFIQGCREFLGGLSPCCFKTGGALAPSAPPVPPPMLVSDLDDLREKNPEKPLLS